MLPPLRNAASAVHPAGDAKPAVSAARIAARRFSSVGCVIHRSVASRAVLAAGAGGSPDTRRAHTQAHQIPSRFGKACARNRTASACNAWSSSACTYCRGPCAGTSTALASSPNPARSMNSAIVRAATGGCVVVAMSVDHGDRALRLQHCVGVDLRHQALHFVLVLTLDLNHLALTGTANLIDLVSPWPAFRSDSF